MNYINETTQIVCSIQAIRQAHPNMSIPDGADLQDIGYATVLPALTVPEAGATQVRVAAPPQLVDGAWRECWVLEDKPRVVPEQITRAQGKIVLLQLGLWQPALDYVAGLTDPLAKATGEVALHDTTYWSRSSPFLNAAAESLGLSSSDLDALFVTASEIIL